MKKELLVAVDVGSTMLDFLLLDKNGGILAKNSLKNPQTLYGSDVINRIQAVVRNPEMKAIMRNQVLDVTKSAIEKMLMECKELNPTVSGICMSGNATMIHILLDYDLESLGQYPFEVYSHSSVICSAKELFGEQAFLEEDCQICLTGCLSAFIGGDILSGLLALGENGSAYFDKSQNNLFLDFGTNGEMVIWNKGTMYATSTACGPAFEGSLRRQKVYGSNLIDAVSLAVRTKKLSREGVLTDPYFESGLEIMNVQLNMHIIQELLAAKAAIAAGIHFLCAKAKISYADVNMVYIAGGFGNYLNEQSAIEIGLLPKAFAGRITYVGNTSLEGATRIVRDPERLEWIDSFYKKEEIEVLQLANEEQYNDVLISHMNFNIYE